MGRFLGNSVGIETGLCSRGLERKLHREVIPAKPLSVHTQVNFLRRKEGSEDSVSHAFNVFVFSFCPFNTRSVLNVFQELMCLDEE